MSGGTSPVSPASTNGFAGYKKVPMVDLEDGPQRGPRTSSRNTKAAAMAAVDAAVEIMRETRTTSRSTRLLTRQALSEAGNSCSEGPLSSTNNIRSLHIDMGIEGATSPFRFVEAGWFQGLSAAVIMVNMILSIMELDKPELRAVFFWPDQVVLLFYVVELVCRALYFRRMMFCGPGAVAAWNALDVVVIAAGVCDQWVSIFLVHALPVRVMNAFHILQFLRIVRVLRIIRIVLEADMAWTEDPQFQTFMAGVIIVNALIMGCETDIEWGGWVYFEQVMLVFYVFELIVGLKRNGFFFFSPSNPDMSWNWLDFIIVMSSVVDSWLIALANLFLKAMSEGTSSHAAHIHLGQFIILMRMLRLMRILRLVKLVKSVRPLYMLVTGVLAAVQGVFWVLVLTVFVLYALGILATRLIGHKFMFPPGVDIDPSVVAPWETVPVSMFTLFRVMSGAASDDEAESIDALMKKLPQVKFMFVFFMVTSSWTLLSILTAVVSENMISTTGQQEEEFRLANAEKEREIKTESLMALFSDVDADKSGSIDIQELTAFVNDDDLCGQASRLVQVPKRDIKELVHIIHASNGDRVELSHFVGCLIDLPAPVTERGVLKLESQLTVLSKQVGDLKHHSTTPALMTSDSEDKQSASRQTDARLFEELAAMRELVLQQGRRVDDVLAVLGAQKDREDRLDLLQRSVDGLRHALAAVAQASGLPNMPAAARGPPEAPPDPGARRNATSSAVSTFVMDSRCEGRPWADTPQAGALVPFQGMKADVQAVKNNETKTCWNVFLATPEALQGSRAE
uniref:EF-hand domain-containing protein n=1 Tax=Zooxanthella nutricula TaxID=1333877 RepID=A0A6V0K7Z6_9DINO|mmetsp:Transcript_85308/g.260822  ORF Transcript_85308/g.260822 Transcript_85308/m.260822 type:complete len:795 (+) Transcript_85308:126-2510(+)